MTHTRQEMCQCRCSPNVHQQLMWGCASSQTKLAQKGWGNSCSAFPSACHLQSRQGRCKIKISNEAVSLTIKQGIPTRKKN